MAVENSNCATCHNQLLGVLREHDRVEGVRSDFSAGCLVIEHHADPSTLLSLIRSTGRAVALAANGERVMVAVDAREVSDCPPLGLVRPWRTAWPGVSTSQRDCDRAGAAVAGTKR